VRLSRIFCGSASIKRVNTSSGLDAATLALVLETIENYIADAIPGERLLALDQTDECPADVIRGLWGEPVGGRLLFLPEEYGGMGGSAVDVYRVCARLAGIDVGLATGVLAAFLGSDPIVVGATPEQRKGWLTEIAERGVLYAYGATEPGSGSDLSGLRTTATPVPAGGRAGGYRLNGCKQWISNGGIADKYTILAQAPGGPSWFVLDRDTAGFTRGRPESKHGIRLSDTAALFFDDVFVPAANLVGGVEGLGLAQAQQVFAYTRMLIAAFGLGAGWAALDRAIQYSSTRIAGGGPLSGKQGFTHKLIVPHAVRLEAARALVESVAVGVDAGEGTDGRLVADGAIAKYLATVAGNLAADAAIQAHGGYGYSRAALVEKIRRDVRVTTIYEGTSEIMELTVARDRWRRHLKSGGRLYLDRAEGLRALHARHPGVGAGTAAIAGEALAGVLEACRLGRLTRHQHVLLRLGELVAAVEGAGCFCRRAAAALDGELPDKADHRFGGAALAAMSRIWARDTALRVAGEGLRWVAAASATTIPAPDVFRLDAAYAAQDGLIADMDHVADVLYGRVAADA
jgi:alkylation response protein AidB-like acyl-CoA dehydrogenase